MWGPVLVTFLLSCTSPTRGAPTPTRCTLRVSARGIYVDGDPMSRPDAIKLCKHRIGAMVVLEDSAPAALWDEIHADLQKAGIKIYMRGLVGDKECMENPLAKGCN